MCTCSWELEMLLSTNLCSQPCILTPHQSTLLPCEIPLVGWSPPLWRSRLLGASCRLVQSTSKAGGYCSLPGNPARSSVQPPFQQKWKLLHQVQISDVSTHLYCLCPPLGKVGLHLLLTPLSSCIHQGGSPWSHLSLGLNKHSSLSCSSLSQKLQPHNILAACHWPCISVSCSCDGEQSKKWGRINKQRD